MIALLQRVTKGRVIIRNDVYSEIKHGYVILLGINTEDTEKDIEVLVPKIVNLRVMSDDQDKMNTSILDTHGQILVVSQFTLCADVTGGRRPSFIRAKNPEEAEILYNKFIERIQRAGIAVKTGVFGEMMNIEIHNDGPVTILLDSKLLL